MNKAGFERLVKEITMNKENIKRLLEETNYNSLLELVNENGLDPEGDLVITEEGTRFWVILLNNQVNILH